MRDVAKIRFLSVMSERKCLRKAGSNFGWRVFLLSNFYFLISSKVFLHPRPDALQCFLDVLDRVGHAEAQITLAKIAEGGPRQPGDAGIVEQRVGQFLRWPPGLLDVGENVKRALGQAAGKTFDLIKAGDHNI